MHWSLAHTPPPPPPLLLGPNISFVPINSWLNWSNDFLLALHHHFLPLEERDTAGAYHDYWLTVQGSPTLPSDPHYLGPGWQAVRDLYIPFWPWSLSQWFCVQLGGVHFPKQHQQPFRERRDSNPELLSEKEECYFCALRPCWSWWHVVCLSQTKWAFFIIQDHNSHQAVFLLMIRFQPNLYNLS